MATYERKQKVHKHAKIDSVKKDISKALGLPPDAIVIKKPDGKVARKNSKLEGIQNKYKDR